MSNSEAIAIVEKRVKEEEEKKQKLQKELDQLGVSQKFPDVVIGSSVKFVIGFNRYERTIPSNAKYSDLQKHFKANDLIGYEDGSKFKVWVRNDTDVKCCFREHFASGNQILSFKNLFDKDLSTLMGLNFEEEIKEDENTFQLKLAVKDKDYAIFISLPKGITRIDAFESLKKLVPYAKKMSIIDMDGDVIQIQNDLDWEYFINESTKLYPSGRFSILLIE